MDTREFCHCSAVCTAGIRTIRMQHVLIINSRDNPDGYFDPIIERPSLQYARFTEHSSFQTHSYENDSVNASQPSTYHMQYAYSI